MPGRRLVLLRHGKAEGRERVRDHERVLAPRGRRDAEAVGRWLVANDIRAELAVVSDAARARETWERVVAGIGPTPAAVPVQHERRVYDAGPEELLDVIAEVQDDAGTVLLVGHNPAVERLASALDDGAGDSAVRGELEEGLPTCGIVVLGVPGTWADLAAGSARLLAVSAPRG